MKRRTPLFLSGVQLLSGMQMGYHRNDHRFGTHAPPQAVQDFLVELVFPDRWYITDVWNRRLIMFGTGSVIERDTNHVTLIDWIVNSFRDAEYAKREGIRVQDMLHVY